MIKKIIIILLLCLFISPSLKTININADKVLGGLGIGSSLFIIGAFLQRAKHHYDIAKGKKSGADDKLSKEKHNDEYKAFLYLSLVPTFYLVVSAKLFFKNA